MLNVLENEIDAKKIDKDSVELERQRLIIYYIYINFAASDYFTTVMVQYYTFCHTNLSGYFQSLVEMPRMKYNNK